VRPDVIVSLLDAYDKVQPNLLKPARVTLEGADTARVTVTPRVAGIAHVILAVEDTGTPPLTSSRRVIFTIKR
jgi:hypothetical protein